MGELTLENLKFAIQQVKQSQADELGVPVEELEWEIAVRQGPDAWFERTGQIVSLDEWRAMLAKSWDNLKEMLEAPPPEGVQAFAGIPIVQSAFMEKLING